MRTSKFLRVCKIESQKLISPRPELKAIKLPGLIQYNEGLKIQEQFSDKIKNSKDENTPLLYPFNRTPDFISRRYKSKIPMQYLFLETVDYKDL